jgi:hypothetical protein
MSGGRPGVAARGWMSSGQDQSQEILQLIALAQRDEERRRARGQDAAACFGPCAPDRWP